MTYQLQEILKRARLHRTTLEYALKRSDVLTGMPESEGQGRHRQFTIQQALKLAICCHLVMVGVSLRDAVKVFEFIEHQVRGRYPEMFGKQLTFKRPNDYCLPWVVEIYDCRFFRVWTDKINEGKYEASKWYLDLTTGETTKSEPSNHLVFVEINLGGLEKALSKED